MHAFELAVALKARPNGGGWSARCPSHDDKSPSLSICSGGGNKVLVHCHAGCDQKQVIDALISRGLWESGDGVDHRPPRSEERRPLTNLQGVDDARRRDQALRIWHSAVPSSGTLVDSYLAARGITRCFSQAIRFHPALRHQSGNVFSAMVSLVTRGTDGMPMGVHRTFLSADGLTKAPVDAAKMMLGPCRGGAVRISNGTGMLMIGEGIETCLSASQATRRQVWAALSTSGMPALELPSDKPDVIVLADGDPAGEGAAQDAAQRWLSEGRRVRIARPPQGQDFNDMLLDSAHANRST